MPVLKFKWQVLIKMSEVELTLNLSQVKHLYCPTNYNSHVNNIVYPKEKIEYKLSSNTLTSDPENTIGVFPMKPNISNISNI